MGKAKPVEPEPAPKIVRSLGETLTIEVTDEEKKYRNKKGPDDVTQIRKEKLKCTVCAKSVAELVKKGEEPFVHMVLGVLVCKDCSSFYGDGYFSVDEDGDDKYCRWCGQGGTLYLCSTCTCAFCKKCIKQNLEKQCVKDLESDDWKCLICNPKPLFECRTVCWFLQEHAAKTKNEIEEETEGEYLPSPSRSKRDRGSKKPNKEEDTSVSKKRKLSEIEDEIEEGKRGKRRKSFESGKDSKQLTPVSTPSNRRSRHQSTKEKENENENESEDGSSKKPSKNESRPKRSKGLKPEEDLTPVKKSPRVSKKQEEQQTNKKKVEEITISDNEEEEEQDEEKSSKIGVSGRSSKSSRKDSSSTKPSRKSKGQEDEEIKERPKRVISDKSVKDSKPIETPSKRPTRSLDKKSSNSPSIKNKKAKQPEDGIESDSPKRSQRATKAKRSDKIEDDDGSIKKSNTSSQLISLIDNNSDSECDSKKRTSRRKAEIKNTPVKSKLHLARNADSGVVQAAGYVNSALSDVLELGVLISNNCEKLCTKSIASSDDVLGVFNKLKQLMAGVHSNLELIEKGLDTKINVWQGVNVQDTSVDNEQKMETDLLNNQENTENIVQTDVKEKEDELINEDRDTETTEQPKLTEQMEVENVEEQTKDNTEESMEVDNDNQDKPCEEDINKENEELETKPENEEATKNEEKDVETSEDKLESSVSSEEKELDTENLTEDKQKEVTEENVDADISLKFTEDVKEKDNECSKNEDTEESVTETNLESADNKVDDDENEPSKQENIENNETENGNESVNNEIEERNEVEEENNKCVIDSVAPVCKSDSLDAYKNDSRDSLSKQSSAIKASNSQDNNGVSDFKVADVREELEDCGVSEERASDVKEEVPVEVDTPTVQEDSSSLASQPKDSEELKNGTSDDDKTCTQKEEDKVKEKEPTEQKSTDKKEEEIVKSSSDEHKSSGSPQLSHTDPSRRLSGDRDRGRYPQEQRWSGDRSGGWNRDHYQDRSWDRARGGNRYRYGRPSRGSWGWNH